MRLIGIASLIHRIKERNALLQEISRALGARIASLIRACAITGRVGSGARRLGLK